MKKLIAIIAYPFKQLLRLLKAVWTWLRRRIIKIPSSEAEAFLMSLALLLSCVWFLTFGKLVETQYVIEEKVKIIEKQAETIETYKIKERTLRVPGKTKVITVTEKQLQTAIKEAQTEATEMRQAKRKYEDMARRYSTAAPNAKVPAARVKTEERINDQFIEDWKKAK